MFLAFAGAAATAVAEWLPHRRRRSVCVISPSWALGCCGHAANLARGLNFRSKRHFGMGRWASGWLARAKAISLLSDSAGR
jgi:hypothetical protein